MLPVTWFSLVFFCGVWVLIIQSLFLAFCFMVFHTTCLIKTDFTGTTVDAMCLWSAMILFYFIF